MRLFLTFTILFLTVACSNQPINNVRYKQYNAYTRTNGMNFEDLGPISMSSSANAWTSCTEVAEDVLAQMISEAHKRGGNALVDVWWLTSRGQKDITPICKVRWFWIGTGIGAITPWAKKVVGFATIANLKGKASIAPINVHFLDKKLNDTENAKAILKKMAMK